MKSFYILCCFSFVMGMLSCKQDTAMQQATEAPATETPAASAEPAQTTPQATPAKEVNQDMTKGHDYTYLTEKILWYKDAYGGEKNGGVQPYKDEWIHLIPDGTFKAGKLQKQTHTGQWSYNHDTQTLFLRPDTKEFKMSEWKVMHNDQMIVWIGTQTYGDQPIQIKMIKKDGLPQ